MIRHLKRRMTVLIMFFVTLVIAALVAVIVVVPAQQRSREAQTFLSGIADKNGMPGAPAQLPGGGGTAPPAAEVPQPAGNSIYSISNIATAELDAGGTVVSWSSNREDLFDEDSVQTIARQVFSSGKDFGTVGGNYYLLRKTPDGTRMVLLDNSVAFASARQTLFFSVGAGAIAWVVFLLLGIYLVNRMLRPVQDAFQKQRQFISDAGHELKTPISVISANAAVLQSEIGDNKWLSYIFAESKRMEVLVRNLMSLASMEDAENKSVHSRFDLSQTVLGAALPFESLAFEKKIILETDVQPDVMLNGNRDQIEQLVCVLLNNAVKYGKDHGVIQVGLEHAGRKTVLSVYNTGMGIEPEEKDRIFERFYRADKARTKDGNSYGLGLAIAGVIAQEHHAKITVDSEYGQWIRFSVVFPQ